MEEYFPERELHCSFGLSLTGRSWLGSPTSPDPSSRMPSTKLYTHKPQSSFFLICFLAPGCVPRETFLSARLSKIVELATQLISEKNKRGWGI